MSRAHWKCLSPGCNDGGDMDTIRTSSGPDVDHYREFGHAVSSWEGDERE